jgi:hypothetical protein
MRQITDLTRETIGEEHERVFHDLASLFPLLLDDAAFGELVADIKQHGVREPTRHSASRSRHRPSPSTTTASDAREWSAPRRTPASA